MQVQIQIRPEDEPGHWADMVSLWATEGAFVLDFAAASAPPGSAQAQNPQTGELEPLVQFRVVSRVRIPPSQAFEIMKALQSQLTLWEQATAARPDPPLYPPDDAADTG